MNPSIPSRPTILLLALVCGACGAGGPEEEPSPLSISGFTSRETLGEEPLFDVRAASARMHASRSVLMIQDVEFTLFREGKKAGRVVSDTGYFYPQEKHVELYGGVTYDAYDDSLHVQAGRMGWDAASSVLRCDSDVEGRFRSFAFFADRLDISRKDNILRLRRSTFIGPG